MSDRLALAHAIEDAGIPRDAAESVATAIARFVEGSAATKADVERAEASLKAEIGRTEATLRGEIAQTRAELKADMVGVRSLLAGAVGRLDTRIERLDATVKAQPNAIMLRLGTLMVVLTGIVLAALRYWPPPGHG
jgi:hypothetical protein